MSDVIDEAQAMTELMTTAAIRRRAEAGPVACGYCHYCGEPLPADQRWCDADCRDDWQAEQDAALRRGLIEGERMMSGGYTWAMDLIQSLGMMVLGWYGWVMKKEMADAKLLREVQEELALAQQKIALIEQQNHNAPTHQDLGDLHNRINDLSGAVRELVGVMSGVQRSLDRVETKLINEGNR